MNGKNLTVDAENSTVNNSATTTGTITITDVSNATWNEFAKENKIVFDDTDAGTKFVVGKDATVASLTVNGPAVVTNNGTVTALVVGEKATGATISNTGEIKTLTANVDVIFEGTAATTTNGTGTVAASPAELLLKKAELAKDYKYDPTYTYSYEDLTIANTQATITYEKSKVTANPKLVMNDMARYLGALYRVDNGATITALDYKGKEYTWNGALKGSNWKNDSTTLVSVITADFVASQDSFNTVTLQLKDANGNTTNLTLKVVLTGN